MVPMPTTGTSAIDMMDQTLAAVEWALEYKIEEGNRRPIMRLAGRTSSTVPQTAAVGGRFPGRDRFPDD